MAASLNGIVINEILPDPTNSSPNFDTDGDGTAEDSDEFVELHNTSASAVDISGWTLQDNGSFSFTFPAGTVIAPGENIVVVTNWDSTEPQPSWVVSLGRGSGVWNNGGDEVILSDGVDSISAVYNGATASQANSDDFGSDTAGESIQRSPDGADTFVVTTPTPECFVAGTRILTPNGNKAVEQLAIGDLIQTADGACIPIRWIGRQTIDPAATVHPLRGYPIWIKAGALGHNQPCRDLYVSPDHALLVDGLLINAGALVNDSSILKTKPTTSFTYYHIELHRHALLVADGIYAESYLPQHNDRLTYDNGETYATLYPSDTNLLMWPMTYPRVSSTNKVPRFVRQRLEAIAHTRHASSSDIADLAQVNSNSG